MVNFVSLMKLYYHINSHKSMAKIESIGNIESKEGKENKESMEGLFFKSYSSVAWSVRFVCLGLLAELLLLCWA